VNKDIPPYSVAVGVPARVVRNRMDDYHAAEEQRAAYADIARKQAQAASDVARSRARR
jgi:acetyltransferase-like isoleucine patch superfamily enzyme